MPLYAGGQRIARLYRGATPIARAYRGETPVFDGAIAPSIALLDQVAWTAGTTSPTVDFGEPEGQSLVVVATGITKSATGADSGAITAITIGGVAGAAAANQGTQNFSGSAIYCAEVASASGVVTIAHGGARDGFGIFVYRLNNLASLTPFDSDGAVATSGTLALNVPAEGFVIGHVVARLGTSTITLTNLSNDGLVSATGSHRMRGGHALFEDADAYSFPYSFTDTGHGGACVASFR